MPTRVDVSCKIAQPLFGLHDIPFMAKLPMVPSMCLGLLLITVPWIWAWFAVRSDPSLADAQGAWTMASYVSVVTVPLGLYIVISSLATRRGE
jgi:hypothetical protein